MYLTHYGLWRKISRHLDNGLIADRVKHGWKQMEKLFSIFLFIFYHKNGIKVRKVEIRIRRKNILVFKNGQVWKCQKWAKIRQFA
jgi:hypothetical protein